LSHAGVAQLVEHLICNQRVGGSNPFASSSIWQKGSGRQGGRGGLAGFFQRHSIRSIFPKVVYETQRIVVRLPEAVFFLFALSSGCVNLQIAG
jgi:hypothetical protein